MTVHHISIFGRYSVTVLSNLVVPPGYVGHIHIVSGGAYILILLLSEDVEGHHVYLCVPMLAGLRSGHLHYFAWATLQSIQNTCYNSGYSLTIICNHSFVDYILSRISKKKVESWPNIQ